MARANRHFIPGYIWHITHRCHQREFLLKFSKDRHRYLQWLYQARKRYDLSILNYTVTSNHIHLLVFDTGEPNVIPKSMQLVAGRTAQEFNQRKDRKGAYWEDRYHATAIENGEHLARCITYIDTNMVRAGVVSHPSLWPFSGYNEIQQPRSKNRLIDHDRLQSLFGAASYHQLTIRHRGWVDDCLKQKATTRQSEWSDSIAVGNRLFVENVKDLLGFRARGRDIMERNEGCHLREEVSPYMALFGAEKDDIGLGNTCFWETYLE